MITSLCLVVAIFLGQFQFIENRLVQAVLVLIVATGLAVDFLRSERRKINVRPGILTTIIALQGFQTLCWFGLRQGEVEWFTASAFSVFIFAVLPWALIALIVFRERKGPDIFRGIPVASIGICGLVFVACLLNFTTDLGSAQSVLVYGGEVNATFSGGARVVLPGFPGVVASGIACGLAMAALTGVLAGPCTYVIRIICFLVFVVVSVGLYQTETRSAWLVTLLSMVLPVALKAAQWTGRKFNLNELQKYVAIYFLIIAALMPVALPVFLPKIAPLLESIPQGGTSILVRQSGESLFTISGRTRIWEMAIEAIKADQLNYFSIQPIAEYQFGIAEWLFSSGLMPGLPQYAHSHNSILNVYFGYGLIGVFILLVSIFLTTREICLLAAGRSHWLKYGLPWIALCGFLSVESLLSPTYQFFNMLLVLLACDLACEDRAVGNVA